MTYRWEESQRLDRSIALLLLQNLVELPCRTAFWRALYKYRRCYLSLLAELTYLRPLLTVIDSERGSIRVGPGCLGLLRFRSWYLLGRGTGRCRRKLDVSFWRHVHVQVTWLDRQRGFDLQLVVGVMGPEVEVLEELTSVQRTIREMV
jgi:hypothetical protein